MANKVILLGRLGKDPELKAIGDDKSVATFSIATSETYWDKSEQKKKEITEWVNCVAWPPAAKFIGEYMKKGDQIYIEGKIRTRTWEAKDGSTRYATEVVVQKVEPGARFSPKRSSTPAYMSDKLDMNNVPSGGKYDDHREALEQDIPDDDLPF
jgi:single-strand DNA-binding protein